MGVFCFAGEASAQDAGMCYMFNAMKLSKGQDLQNTQTLMVFFACFFVLDFGIKT